MIRGLQRPLVKIKSVNPSEHEFGKIIQIIYSLWQYNEFNMCNTKRSVLKWNLKFKC